MWVVMDSSGGVVADWLTKEDAQAIASAPELSAMNDNDRTEDMMGFDRDGERK